MSTAIIFDMDGTLFQTNTILELSLEEAFSYLRANGLWDHPTPIEKYRGIMGVPLPKVWETLLPEHSIQVREQVNEYFHEKLIENILHGNGSLYPYVEEILAQMKREGCRLFIASNGLPEYLHAIINHFNMDRWITETFSIQQIETLDKADLVNSIVEKYDIHEGIVVGDRISDFHAAKKNGLTAIGCNFDFAKVEELKEADLVINDFKELESIFDLDENQTTQFKMT